ncbi:MULTISPECIES: hypothetical protein [Pontibacillus]|uniref:Uncharacterized protein n=1 Tax=Pontibacillus chungwhensis TaxID=265426 RepID=A0ABY8V2D7_9BACI|nr:MULTISPECIES: hypothetical protein [Pontibacillus]MCD5324796.1 hypothetical protein [Pontibacillus sp. HN14]WIF98755.1 hypothetical protein QNI29_03635 [Pontibacillus chungwhensis]
MFPINDIQKQLASIQKEIQEVLKGEHKFREIFTNDFMQSYTQYNTIEEFFDSSPVSIHTQEDLDSTDSSELDEHVKKTTQFQDWEEFSTSAANLYARKRLKEKGIDV